MTFFAVWSGGNGYSCGIDNEDELESFESLSDIEHALSERYESNGIRKVDFNYVNREKEFVYTPCVDDSSMFYVWDDAHYEDGVYSVGDEWDHTVEFVTEVRTYDY